MRDALRSGYLAPRRPKERPDRVSERKQGPAAAERRVLPESRRTAPQPQTAALGRYTHRVAISNSRLIAADETGVTFSYKNYRIEGPARYKTMTLKPGEFIRRFLMHVLPKRFHRIRHYGLLASGAKAETIARAQELTAAATPAQTAHKQQAPDSTAATDKPTHPCACCGGRMNIIETFERGSTPRYRPPPPTAIRIDTS
jgi:hypothetical protein